MKTPVEVRRSLLVCGGGTGGHFFSGLAVAEKYLSLFPNSRVVFVGTRYGIEARVDLADSRMSKEFIFAKGVMGKGISQKLLALLYVCLGIVQSFFLLIKIRPSIVIGVGGYASFPTVFAAVLMRWLFRWKVIVLDQNSSPGVANRIFAKFPLFAYCAFRSRGFQLVDLPVRQRIVEKARLKRGFDWPPKKILIIGGSQGAHGLNQKLKDVLIPLQAWNPSVEIFHQTGKNDEAEMKDFYKKINLRAEVFAFTNEIEKYLDLADLIISRSGAMTIFEILQFDRPSIFVPFPKAADGHQQKNAEAVQDRQWIIAESNFSWERLQALLSSPRPALPGRDSSDLESWDRILSC